MAYQSQVPNVEHGVIKPQKQIAAAHGVLERELVLPNFFSRQSIDSSRARRVRPLPSATPVFCRGVSTSSVTTVPTR